MFCALSVIRDNSIHKNQIPCSEVRDMNPFLKSHDVRPLLTIFMTAALLGGTIFVRQLLTISRNVLLKSQI